MIGHASGAGRPIAVLAYHSVGADARRALRRWQVPAGLLDEQLCALAAAGHRLESLSSVLDRPEAAAVALTFDDGFADFLTALPIVERHAGSATLYVPTGLIGGAARWLAPEGEERRPLLTWQELVDLPGSVEIGSHSRTHLPLDTVTPQVLRAEVAGSRQELMDRLARPIRSFAYPFGFHDRHVRAAVRDAGYSSACEVGYRRHRPSRGVWEVSRLLVTPDLAPHELVRLVDGGRHQVRALTRAVRPVHRAVRRLRAESAAV